MPTIDSLVPTWSLTDQIVLENERGFSENHLNSISDLFHLYQLCQTLDQICCIEKKHLTQKLTFTEFVKNNAPHFYGSNEETDLKYLILLACKIETFLKLNPALKERNSKFSSSLINDLD